MPFPGGALQVWDLTQPMGCANLTATVWGNQEVASYVEHGPYREKDPAARTPIASLARPHRRPGIRRLVPRRPRGRLCRGSDRPGSHHASRLRASDDGDEDRAHGARAAVLL